MNKIEAFKTINNFETRLLELGIYSDEYIIEEIRTLKKTVLLDIDDNPEMVVWTLQYVNDLISGKNNGSIE